MLFRAGPRLNPQILIDAIVRQTTVLVARLSTVEGVRSPLGHIANEVFVGLVAELENQGVSKKVIADMFGMALRSYRQKVQRLGESVTARGVTLWTAVQRFLADRGSATRTELFAQFQYDDEASVRGILNDLVENGLIVRSGRGDDTAIGSPQPRSCATRARWQKAGRKTRTPRWCGCRSIARVQRASTGSRSWCRCRVLRSRARSKRWPATAEFYKWEIQAINDCGEGPFTAGEFYGVF